MYTAEQFAKKNGELFYEILNLELAEAMVERFERLSVVSCDQFKVMFFTNNHMFGYPVLDKNWVPTSFSKFPFQVVPREEFPEGIVATASDFKKLFYNDYTQLNSLDELLEFLNHGQDKLEEKYMREAKPAVFKQSPTRGTYTIGPVTRLGELPVEMVELKRVNRWFSVVMISWGLTYRDGSTYIRKNEWPNSIPASTNVSHRKAKNLFHRVRKLVRLQNIKR